MGQQVSKLPSGFQPGVDSWYGVVCTNFHFIPDFRHPDTQDYYLRKCAYTGSFVALLLLLSWWYGQSSFEKRMDPVEAADKDRTAAIKQRDDAQRGWEEMGEKHEQALRTNLQLRAELDKAFKDLPWLEQRNCELVEENSKQHNEIERLSAFKRDYDELLQKVSTYGMLAKRPDYHQQESERVQRQLEISNNLLRKSERSVKILQEELGTQHEKANEENCWLRAKLKNNARSTAYWARYRLNDCSLRSKPGWGVRCACTEPEIAYSLKDQTPRIAELEATVAARDLTITHLRGSRKNGTASTSTTAKTSLPSAEGSKSGSITKSQTAKTTTIVHACEHEQQCKTLGKQVLDDATTIEMLRKECKESRDAASDDTTANAAEINVKAKFDRELAAKDTIIRDLQEEKEMKHEELAAKDKVISRLREEKTAADKDATTKISNLDQKLSENCQDLANAREARAKCEREMGQQKAKVEELETAQCGLEDTIEQKDREIDDLEKANQELAEQPDPDSAENLQRLRTANTNLDELRREHAECKGQADAQAARICELEAAGRESEATIRTVNTSLEELSRVHAGCKGQAKTQTTRIRELEAAGRESEATIRTANTNLDELRREHTECKRQAETHTARICQLEAAGRELEATIRVKVDRITKLEEQIAILPSKDSIERQLESYNETINKKDRDYAALYNLYQKMLAQQKLAEAKHNEDMQSLNTLQQSATAKQLELQRLWNEYNNLHALHTNYDGQIGDLQTQLRQGANTYTDLQTQYNTQAAELDAANQNGRELESKIANLQQANADLEQMSSSSESTFEKYRVEGENRARPIWQAIVDREMSTQALKLKASEEQAFKLRNQLQQAKTQANPLREMQIKAREDAVQAREDALKLDTDAMDHDQQGSKVDPEIKTLESKLAAANKDAGDARARNRGIQNQLNKEKKERADEKARHEKQLKKEQEDFERRIEISKLRLEKENPLKGAVGNLQNEVARLRKELDERRLREKAGQ